MNEESPSIHPMARFSLQELEQATETAFFRTAPEIFLAGGVARYTLILEAVQTFQQTSMAGKVGRALLTAQARGLRTVQLMAGRGYPQEAAALTRVGLERAYHQAFIGRDEEKAEKWRTHDSNKTFEPFINCVRSVGKRWYGNDPDIRKQFEEAEAETYADVSGYSHHNPRLSRALDLRLVDGEVTLTPMPTFTPQGFLGCADLFLTMQRAAEVSLQAAVEAFSHDDAERHKWQSRIEVLRTARSAHHAWLEERTDDERLHRELGDQLNVARTQVLVGYSEQT